MPYIRLKFGKSPARVMSIPRLISQVSVHTEAFLIDFEVALLDVARSTGSGSDCFVVYHGPSYAEEYPIPIGETNTISASAA